MVKIANGSIPPNFHVTDFKRHNGEHQYNIHFNYGISLQFTESRIAEKYFEIFCGDFEDKSIDELFPQGSI